MIGKTARVSALFVLAACGLGFGMGWGAGQARAAASDWSVHEFARVRLVSAVAAVGELGEIRLGLQFRLNPGWKTYWRSPGDAGLPAQIDWAGSENLERAAVLWPIPERHTLLGIETLGYENEVLLPILARPKAPGQPVRLRAAVDYLVCEKICVPAHAELRLDLPAGAATPSVFVDLVDRWRARVPGDPAAAGLTIGRVALVGSSDRAQLAVSVAAREPLAAPDMIVEGPAGYRFGRAKAELGSDGRALLLVPVATAGALPAALVGAEVTLTLIDGARAAETRYRIAAGGAYDVAKLTDGASLGWMLLVALIGGLILNLMPCVLPVLSLKLMAVVGHGGERRAVRLGFLATSAGIMASFLTLALGALALRMGGMAVGWGIQFQQPLFIAGMALLLTLFACNLWGWFEIAGPRWAFAAAETGAASQGMFGHFLTGALATLLATPCSAPFLGTALGFALARGPLEIVSIFLVLGFGLALPYLLVAAMPSLAARLPRPGKWMLHLRVVLGVLLALSALWLMTVLAAQRGAMAAVYTGMLLVALSLVLASRGRIGARARAFATAAVAALAVAAVALPSVMPVAPGGGTRPADAKNWRKFDEAAIPALVAQGRVVFVDVTADWCITCQANKSFVLNRGAVAERLGGGAVIPMRADWTRPDPAIAQYLSRYGRYGIPFNVVYGPGAPSGIALPELLTSEAVLGALDRAGSFAAAPLAVGPGNVATRP